MKEVIDNILNDNSVDTKDRVFNLLHDKINKIVDEYKKEKVPEIIMKQDDLDKQGAKGTGEEE